MCMPSAPSIPAPLPPPPPPPEKAKQAAPAVKAARKEQELKQRNLQGAGATNVTGARGIMAPLNTGQTTLLSS